jgi:hypothetical protein
MMTFRHSRLLAALAAAIAPAMLDPEHHAEAMPQVTELAPNAPAMPESLRNRHRFEQARKAKA